MKVYVVSKSNVPAGVCYTHKEAQDFYERLHKEYPEAIIIIDGVEMKSLFELVNDYFAMPRKGKPDGLVHPNRDQAFKFLVSEIGELSDALVHGEANWVRNNPDQKDGTEQAIRDECGDVLMMLTKTLGDDPLQAMLEKFQRKGFRA